MRVAIFGVSGIAKEHIRALHTHDIYPSLLVDFKHVLEREIDVEEAAYAVTNDYPGHKFTVGFPACKVAYSPIGPAVLREMSITHAIVCTPSTLEGREFISDLNAKKIVTLCEKPLVLRPRFGREFITVNYNHAFQARRHDALARVYARAPAPAPSSWRWGVGKFPVLWDLGVHAFHSILVNRGKLTLDTVYSYGQSRFHGVVTGVEVEVEYATDGQSVPSFQFDGVEVDWQEGFDESINEWIHGGHVADVYEAITTEDLCREIQGAVP